MKIELLLLGGFALILSFMAYIGLKSRINEQEIDERMVRVADLIKSGSFITLNTQFFFLSIILIGIYVGLFFLQRISIANGIGLGAILSMLCIYYSIEVSVNGNLLTAVDSRDGVADGFKTAYSCGRTVGTFLLGISLISISLYYFCPIKSRDHFLIGLSLGSAIISVFIRISGGIFTKAADIGADLVGKVFNDMPEDDPRNPGVIADNIGDNIGDCVGTVSDIFSTYVCGFMACVFLGVTSNFAMFVSIFSSSIACLIATNWISELNAKVKTDNIKEGSKVIFSTINSMISTSLIISVILFGLIAGGYYYLYKGSLVEIYETFGAFLVGVFIVRWVLFITNRYTSVSADPVKKTIAATKSGGVSMNIILGYSYSLEAVFFIIMGIILLLLVSYGITQTLSGVCVSLMSTLGFAASIMTMDSYGPIVDNAGGIANMSHSDEHVRDNTDILDSVGNATKALTKGYSAGISLITSIIVIIVYVNRSLCWFGLNEYLLFGAFIGSIVPFFFAGSIIKSVYKVANDIFQVISAKIRNKEDPSNDEYYNSTISSLTYRSMTSCIVPITSIFFPFIVYFIFTYINLLDCSFQSNYMAGVLLGTTITSLLLGIQMTIGGGAWDNVKKGIEETNKKMIKEKLALLEIKIMEFDNYQAATINQIMQSNSSDLTELKLDLHDLYKSNDKPGLNRSMLNDLVERQMEINALRTISNAAVAGDTLGDPLKDTAGTSLNVLPKIVFLIALLISILSA